MRTATLGVMALTLLGSACMPFSPQTRKLTAEVFPDPAPELALPTPAFDKERGFTRYEELQDYLARTVPAGSTDAEVVVIGQSQAGRDIPMVRLHATEEARVRVWLQGGLHGNEPASSEGLLLLLHHLMSDPDFADVRRYAEIALVPTANLDGYQVQGRYARNGLDLNRDQTKLHLPESRVLRGALLDFDAHVAVDFHEYRPYRRDFVKLGANGVTGLYDVMFLYSGNLNVPAPLRDLTEQAFVEPARQAMQAHGLSHHDYVTTRDVLGDIHFSQGSVNARSSATSYALSHTVSSLIEVRGVGLGRRGFERRVKATYWVAESYLRSAVAQAEQVQRVLSETVGAPDPVTVDSAGHVGRAPLELWDLHTHAPLTLDVVIHDNTRSEPVRTRPRPASYVVLPGATEVLDRLGVLGIDCEPLGTAGTRQVERYVVDDYRRDLQRYEGVRRQHVTARLEPVQRDLPADACTVDMGQRRAGLAVEVLEPEAANSFVSFDVLRTSAGDELPYFRIPASAPAAPASPTAPGGSL